MSSQATAAVEEAVTLTDGAAHKVRTFLEQKGDEIEGAGLRVGVKGGGCSGFTYTLALDNLRDGDHIFETGGIKVFVTDESLPYVKASVVDFVESFEGSGFQVENPNAVAACGCGTSFRVDESASCGSS